MVRARHAEVIAFRSELLSLNCPRHPLLHALLPAYADPQVFTRQDCPAYARGPLHTVGLLEAAHQYSLQDMGRSTRTPNPTALFTQEWQFKNLQSPMLFFAAQRSRRHGVKVQTGRQILEGQIPLHKNPWKRSRAHRYGHLSHRERFQTRFCVINNLQNGILSLECCIREFIALFLVALCGRWAESSPLLLPSGWGLLCSDSLLVPKLGVPEIGHRQVVGQVLVQWQICKD